MAIGTEIPAIPAAVILSTGFGICWGVVKIVRSELAELRSENKALIKASRKAHEVAHHGRVDNGED